MTEPVNRPLTADAIRDTAEQVLRRYGPPRPPSSMWPERSM